MSDRYDTNIYRQHWVDGTVTGADISGLLNIVDLLKLDLAVAGAKDRVIAENRRLQAEVDAWRADRGEQVAATLRLSAELDEAMKENESLAADLDKAEQRTSELTRELEAKTRRLIELEAERNEFRDGAVMYAAMVSERNDERDQLKARIAELEARPVSAPAGLDPRTAPKGYPLGWTQHADGEYDPKRVAEAYDALRIWHIDLTREEAERRLNDWSGRARLTGADVGMVLALFPEAGVAEGPEVAGGAA